MNFNHAGLIAGLNCFGNVLRKEAKEMKKIIVEGRWYQKESAEINRRFEQINLFAVREM